MYEHSLSTAKYIPTYEKNMLNFLQKLTILFKLIIILCNEEPFFSFVNYYTIFCIVI